MASKANKTQTDDTDNGDAPLLDLNEASVKKLISRAKKRGYITYDELNNALPQDQMSSEQIEDVMAALNDMGVNIVENEEASEDGDDSPEDEAEAVDQADEDGDGDGAASRSVPEKKKETIDRTDRSEEHTSELQSLMRISYAVFCLKKKIQHRQNHD